MLCRQHVGSGLDEMLHFAHPRGCHEASVYKFGLFKHWVHTKFHSNQQSFDEHVEPLEMRSFRMEYWALIGRGMTLQLNDSFEG